MTLTDNIFLYIALATIILLQLKSFQGYRKELIVISSLLIIGFFDQAGLSIGIILTYLTFKLTNNITKIKFFSNIILIIIGFIVYKTYIVNNFFPIAGNYIEVVSLLGFSFYSLKLIHYTFERYKGTLEQQNPVTLLAYTLFFPALLSGPVNRIEPFLEDLNKPIIPDYEKVLTRIVFGFSKIVIISPLILNNIKLMHIETMNEGFLKVYAKEVYHWVDLYVQFSGYMDIVIGIAALMGFSLIENFNKPYLSKNLLDFWSRWHISLAKFIKDYVFFPIAMSTRNYGLAVFIALLIFALWHDISIYYVTWGCLQVMGIIIAHIYIKKNFKYKMPQVISTILSLNYVVAASVASEYIANYIILIRI